MQYIIDTSVNKTDSNAKKLAEDIVRVTEELIQSTDILEKTNGQPYEIIVRDKNEEVIN
ncbi:hypothetical protein [Litchfieldia alkalitelluris]|uniref:hypothetical protein n=1 Tax=Litchfieldia alkalitelluris TaxID=304268 RepID=UPI001474873B|nr:hypothetical protein [Litchfieldia alkalitelluris]